MSFWVNVKQDLETDANAALNAAKVGLNYIDNVFTTDVLPALETAFESAVEKLGQEAVAAILNGALGNASSSALTAGTTS